MDWAIGSENTKENIAQDWASNETRGAVDEFWSGPSQYSALHFRALLGITHVMLSAFKLLSGNVHVALYFLSHAVKRLRIAHAVLQSISPRSIRKPLQHHKTLNFAPILHDPEGIPFFFRTSLFTPSAISIYDAASAPP